MSQDIRRQLERQRDSARAWAVDLEQDGAHLRDRLRRAGCMDSDATDDEIVALVRDMGVVRDAELRMSDRYREQNALLLWLHAEQAWKLAELRRTGCYPEEKGGTFTYVTPPWPKAMLSTDGVVTLHPAPEPQPTKGCTDTHSVATGYGVLRCDLQHPHPMLHHHDPQHRIIWRRDEDPIEPTSPSLGEDDRDCFAYSPIDLEQNAREVDEKFPGMRERFAAACGSVAPFDPEPARCSLPAGHEGVHENRRHYDYHGWSELTVGEES